MNIKALDNPSGFSKSIIINTANNQDFLKLNTDQVKYLSEKKISNSELFEVEFLATAKGVSSLINQITDQVKVIAVGAGSGSKLLSNLNVDLVITGELSHHEILHETHRNVSVIVTDHSNTEVMKELFFNYFKK